MFEAIAFYDGVQWIEYSDATRRFQRWSAPTWFPTPVTNEIAPRVQTMVSRLLRSKPAGRVRPKSNDPEDREAANVAEQILGHCDDVTHEDELRQDAAITVSIMGTVIFKDFFNPQAGKLIRIPRLQPQESPVLQDGSLCPACGTQDGPEAVGTPCLTCPPDPTGGGATPVMAPNQTPAIGPDGQPVTQTDMVPALDEMGQPIVDEVREGEIQTQVRKLFNFYWDPKASSLRQAQWCGEGAYCDLDWIDQNFPEMGPFVGQESGVDTQNFYEASILGLVGPSIQGSAQQGGGGMNAYRHGAVVKEYQEKPSSAYPKGLHLIVAGGVLLYKGPLPIVDDQGDPTGDFNWTEFQYDLVPGRFAGRTPTCDMVLLQRRLNSIDAQKIINRKTILNPWILAPKGSGITPGSTSMRPGAFVTYNYVGVGQAPQVVPGTPLPDAIDVERDQVLQAMDRLAQDARLANTDIPSGIKSGIALNFLKEQADEAAVPRLQRWGTMVAERARKRLLLAQRFYKEPRTVKLMGQGTDWQVACWMGADIRGNVDVVVDPGSLIPRSRSAQIQTVFDSIEQGIINPQSPIDRQKLIEELGIPSFETEIGPDRRRALKENTTIEATGMPMPINPEDNHEIHLLTHLARMKDPAFDTMTPMAQQSYRQHKEAHMIAMATSMSQQMGAPGGPGQVQPGGGPGGPEQNGGTESNMQPNAPSGAPGAPSA